MRRRTFLAASALALAEACGGDRPLPTSTEPGTPLPSLRRGSAAQLDDVLTMRRSIRSYSDEPVDDADISRLLWAAQGVSASWGGRTAPSAGGLYPLELYVATSDGLARYVADEHATAELTSEDRRGRIAAATGQDPPAMAPVLVVITGVPSRTASKYGDRAERYVHLEAGHACQNLLLEVTALGLAAVPIGAFSDDAIRASLGIGGDETPLYVVPIGHPG